MKQSQLLTLFLLTGMAPLAAQTNIFPATGNVGIGTTNPGSILTLGGSPIVTVDTFDGSDNKTMLLSSGGAASITRGAYITLKGNEASSNAGDIFLNAGSTGGEAIRFTTGGGTERLTILNTGNVGIGTTTPSHKLSVNGTIRAKEVIVDTGWSDYVFKPGYQLASLSEVEGAIMRDGHLPGIPSAAEVAQGGVSLGDMQARLLAKVEELTLHQIQMAKDLTMLKAENARLQRQLTALSIHP